MTIQSLHIKVSFSVATAALLIVLLSSFFFYDHSYESSYADSERSVQQLLKTISNTAAIAAYVDNKELAQQVVDGLSVNDIVVGAQITAGGNVIGRQGKVTDVQQGELVSLTLTAPFDQTEQVGEVSVLPNLPLIAKRAQDAAMATTLGLAAQAGVVALLVLILVYWMMTRPLSRLSGRLHSITPGDGSRIDIASRHKGDEIGLLSSDINTLLTTVEKMLEEERQLRHRVEALENRFRGIFEESSAGIFLIDETGRLVTANPAFFNLTGLKEDYPHLEDFNVLERIFVDVESAKALMMQALETQAPCSEDLRIKDGTDRIIRWGHCTFSPSASGRRRPTVEGVIYDVTRRKQEEETARQLAEQDSLTGLMNRHAVEVALEEMIADPKSREKGFTLLLIDLDGFKAINDTHGHDAGDTALRAIAERLEQQVRESDLVARLGGDEFLLVLHQTRNLDIIERIAQNIIDSQKQPIEVEPGVFNTVGTSIGIALFPDHGDNDISLRKRADQAMYAVKRRGKNGFAIYSVQLDEGATPSR